MVNTQWMRNTKNKNPMATVQKQQFKKGNLRLGTKWDSSLILKTKRSKTQTIYTRIESFPFSLKVKTFLNKKSN